MECILKLFSYTADGRINSINMYLYTDIYVIIHKYISYTTPILLIYLVYIYYTHNYTVISYIIIYNI